jgi:hypothetical protein
VHIILWKILTRTADTTTFLFTQLWSGLHLVWVWHRWNAQTIGFWVVIFQPKFCHWQFVNIELMFTLTLDNSEPQFTHQKMRISWCLPCSSSQDYCENNLRKSIKIRPWMSKCFITCKFCANILQSPASAVCHTPWNHFVLWFPEAFYLLPLEQQFYKCMYTVYVHIYKHIHICTHYVYTHMHVSIHTHLPSLPDSKFPWAVGRFHSFPSSFYHPLISTCCQPRINLSLQ